MINCKWVCELNNTFRTKHNLKDFVLEKKIKMRQIFSPFRKNISMISIEIKMMTPIRI